MVKGVGYVSEGTESETNPLPLDMVQALSDVIKELDSCGSPIAAPVSRAAASTLGHSCCALGRLFILVFI